MEHKNCIALIDCDNFFVSCERLFRPELAYRPVLVLSSNDACVIARSEEVKRLGIKMGEPYFTVRDVCKKNGVVTFSSNFELYRDLSDRVMDVLERFAQLSEVYSVDEAFLELPISVSDHTRALKTARIIRETVLFETGIPVSVGVAGTKTLAKIALHYAKPKRGGKGWEVVLEDGLVREKLLGVDIGDVWGIGRQLALKLKRENVNTAFTFAANEDGWIRKRTGLSGVRTARELRGIRCYTVGEEPELRKSLVHSETFGAPTCSYNTVEAAVASHARKTAEMLRKEHVIAKHIGVLIRPKGRLGMGWGMCGTETLPEHTSGTLAVVESALRMLKRLYRPGIAYTKAGVYVRDVIPEGAQPKMTLFGRQTAEEESLMHSIDILRSKYGDVIQMGAEIHKGNWHARCGSLSPRYTTRWSDIKRV